MLMEPTVAPPDETTTVWVDAPEPMVKWSFADIAVDSAVERVSEVIFSWPAERAVARVPPSQEFRNRL